MAKVAFRAGAECDILSSQEHAEHLNRIYRSIVGSWEDRDGEYELIAPEQITLDSSGNGSKSVYRVRLGYRAFLTRFTLDYPGSDFSHQASCNVRIVNDDSNTPAALRIGNNVLPSTYEASKSHAPIFQGGQRISVYITGGPVSTVVTSTGQVVLVPIDRRVHGDPIVSSG